MDKSLQNETDEWLVEAIAQRNSAAFAVLYDRYGQRMYRYFYRMFWQDAAKSEDFAQDLFLKIIEKAHTFRKECAFKTWIYTLAANMCKNEFRRTNYRETAVLPLTEDTCDYLPETIDQVLVANALRACIDQLDIHYRTCFVLRFQEELSVREISDVTGIPEGTVKSRLHRALQKVSVQFQKTGISNEVMKQ